MVSEQFSQENYHTLCRDSIKIIFNCFKCHWRMGRHLLGGNAFWRYCVKFWYEFPWANWENSRKPSKPKNPMHNSKTLEIHIPLKELISKAPGSGTPSHLQHQQCFQISNKHEFSTQNWRENALGGRESIPTQWRRPPFAMISVTIVT